MPEVGPLAAYVAAGRTPAGERAPGTRPCAAANEGAAAPCAIGPSRLVSATRNRAHDLCSICKLHHAGTTERTMWSNSWPRRITGLAPVDVVLGMGVTGSSPSSPTPGSIRVTRLTGHLAGLPIPAAVLLLGPRIIPPTGTVHNWSLCSTQRPPCLLFCTSCNRS